MTALSHAIARIGRGVFAGLGVLLPGHVRRSKWAQIRTTFLDGLADRTQAGLGSVFAFVVKECTGLVIVAVGARRSAGWPPSRHTQPPRRGRAVPAVIQDLLFAIRNLARRPATMGLAIGTFAVGVGASAAMFSVIDPVLLRPLPFYEPERLYTVYPTIPDWIGHPTLGDRWRRGSFSLPEYADWRERQTAFEFATLIGSAGARFTGDGEPEVASLGQATWELFPMLGVSPALGRLFGPDEDPESRVLLLNEQFWQRRFGGDPSIVGREIQIGQRPWTVIGIVPGWFQLHEREVVGWVPFTGDMRAANPGNHSTRVIARLRDGVTREFAETESSEIFRTIVEPEHIQHTANVLSRIEDVTRDVRAPLVLLVAAAGVLLAVACANVATLLLGAGVEREEELAVRGALGAGRGRLVTQLVTENLFLAALGAVVGVGIAVLLTEMLVYLAPPELPRLELVTVNGRVVAFAALLSAASGLAFGLVPAWSLSRTDVARAMQGGRTRTASRNRLQAGIVVAEMALATVLLVGAALLTRTMMNLNNVDTGFDARPLLTVRVSPDFSKYFGANAPEDGPQRFVVLQDRIREELAAIPGVRAVGLTTAMPFTTDRANNEIELEGYELAEGELLLGERQYVSANYPDMVGMRLREGRYFEEGEDTPEGGRVTLVNASLARHAWPGESALGRRLTFWGGEYTIIGVVDDLRDRSLINDPGLQYIMPLRHQIGQSPNFVIQADIDPLAIAPLVRQRIWSVEPDMPITSVMPMTERIRGSLSEQRYRSRLVVAFALLAATMALLGVYGVTARSVSRRTRELGIRVALGAERGRLLSLVLRQGLRLAVVGGAVGLGVSLATTRLIESFLYGTTGTDLVTLVGVVVAVSVMAVGASFAPALRATRVDPIVVLREQ